MVHFGSPSLRAVTAGQRADLSVVCASSGLRWEGGGGGQPDHNLCTPSGTTVIM